MTFLFSFASKLDVWLEFQVQRCPLCDDNITTWSLLLQAEGLTAGEAALIIQKFWGKHKKNKENQNARSGNTDLGRYTNSKRMTDLIMFSQNVSYCTDFPCD